MSDTTKSPSTDELLSLPLSAETELETYRRWIVQIADVCEQAASGNLEARLLNVDVDGDLARAVHGINSMLDYTDAFVRESKAALDCAAKGKFFRRVLLRGMTGTFKQASQIINSATSEMQVTSIALKETKAEQLRRADEFEQTVKGITSVVASASTELCATAKTLAETAEHTVRESTNAVDVSSQSADNVRNVSDSTEQLSGAAREIDEKMQQSSHVVRQAIQEAEHANDTIEGLQSSSASIDAVVRMISDIAQQTNLLALNAAIEAARAGEAGRGFAIVAQEVKALAQQTEKATDRVTSDLNSIQSGTTETVSAIAQFSETIEQLNAISESISHSVHEQNTATLAISQNVNEVAIHTDKVTDNISTVSKIADETSHSIAELLIAADELSQQAEILSGSVEGFLVKIRA